MVASYMAGCAARRGARMQSNSVCQTGSHTCTCRACQPEPIHRQRPPLRLLGFYASYAYIPYSQLLCKHEPQNTLQYLLSFKWATRLVVPGDKICRESFNTLHKLRVNRVVILILISACQKFICCLLRISPASQFEQTTSQRCVTSKLLLCWRPRHCEMSL